MSGEEPLTYASAGVDIAAGDAAVERINVPAGACIYVGDDRRDVQAGRAAGMKTVVVKFGYLHGNDPETWNADAMIDTPQELLQHL